nr:hypothetical protein Iba_chr07aCG4670 [Ipomoea batatas]
MRDFAPFINTSPYSLAVSVKSFHATEAPAVFLVITAPSGKGGDGNDPLLSFERDGEAGVVAAWIESPPSSNFASISVSSQSGLLAEDDEDL